MSVVKVRIQKDFTVLYNGVLENPRLSFKAKGLWAYCMSRPDNWEFHVTHLATVSKDKVDAVYSALKELEAEGLVTKRQENKGKGEGGGRGGFGPVDYTIYPYPQEIQKIFTLREIPVPEIPVPENPALLSTDMHKELKKEKNYEPAKEDPKASELVDFFYQEILKANPRFTKKPSKNCLKSSKALLKHRTLEELKTLVSWSLADSFWSGVLHSPGGLLKNLDKIESQMNRNRSKAVRPYQAEEPKTPEDYLNHSNAWVWKEMYEDEISGNLDRSKFGSDYLADYEKWKAAFSASPGEYR